MTAICCCDPEGAAEAKWIAGTAEANHRRMVRQGASLTMHLFSPVVYPEGWAGMAERVTVHVTAPVPWFCYLDIMQPDLPQKQ